MSESSRLRLPFLAASQAQKHVTHNEALVALDTLVQLSVLDKDLASPPGSPAEGDCYIVAASATGAWTGWDGRIARFEDSDWRSFLPGAGDGAGWLAWVQDEAALYVFDGADWGAVGGGGSGEANTASNLGSTVGRQGVFASKSGVDLRFKSLVAAGGLSLSADANEITVDGSGKVGTARTIGTSGLASGGGDLSADRTITVPVASQAEAEAGTDNAKAMTPLRTAEALLSLFTIAAALIADGADLLGDAPDTLITAEAMHDIATAQTIADSASMSMSMEAGLHAVVDAMAQDGTFTINDLIPGWSGWVLFQTDGSARTVQFQTSAVNMGEAWTGTRQKQFGASSKWMGHYTVQPGGGSPYLQWTFVKEGV